VKIVPGGAIVSSNHDGGQFEPNIRQGQFNVVAGRDSEDTKSTGSRCYSYAKLNELPRRIHERHRVRSASALKNSHSPDSIFVGYCCVQRRKRE
jgi:hypothetical protein